MSDPAYSAANAESTFDLIVFDQCSPTQMPLSNTLFIGSVPPTETSNQTDAATPTVASPTDEEKKGVDDQTKKQWQFGSVQGPTIVLDVNRSNPITQYLEMGSVSIIEARTVTPPESGTVLMTGDLGPLFAVAPRGPFQDAVLGFSIVQATGEGVGINTDWGIKRSFPVFVYSAVEFLGGGVNESSAPSVQPGWPIGLQLSSRFKEFTVVAPNGQRTELSRGEESRYLFTKTDLTGVYQVSAQGIEAPVETFCVNLFSSRESNLAVADSIKMGYEKVAATGSNIEARQETWRWILLAGLILLVAEWVVFNRRIFV